MCNLFSFSNSGYGISYTSILHFMKLSDGIEFMWPAEAYLDFRLRYLGEGIWNMLLLLTLL